MLWCRDRLACFGFIKLEGKFEVSGSSERAVETLKFNQFSCKSIFMIDLLVCDTIATGGLGCQDWKLRSL